MSRLAQVALATLSAIALPALMAGTALAADPDNDSTIIDLGDGLVINVCLYASLDELLDDLGDDEDDTPAPTAAPSASAKPDEGGLIDDITGGDGLLGLDAVDELLDALRDESFAERREHCDDDPSTPPSTTPTSAPPTTTTISPTVVINKPTVTRNTTIYRQTRQVPVGHPETGGGPIAWSLPGWGARAR